LALEKAEREKAAIEKDFLSSEFENLMDSFNVFMSRMH